MTTTASSKTPYTAVCFNCGDTYLNAAGQCVRCKKIAIATPTQEGRDIESHLHPAPRDATFIRTTPKEKPSMPSHIRDQVPTTSYVTPAPVPEPIRPPEPPQKVKLPAIKDAIRLVELINNLPIKLQAERETILKRIQADELRLVDLDRAITALQQLPAQIEIEDADPETAGVVRSKDGSLKWHPNYERCQDCGHVDRPYVARGFCSSCYPRHAPSANNRTTNGQ